jgi:hypothetical protein
MKIKIKIKPWEVRIGHQPHISGTGVREDRRTRRERTRNTQNKKAIREFDN